MLASRPHSGHSTDTCDFPKADIVYGVAGRQPITSADMFVPLRKRSPDPAAAGFLHCFRGVCALGC